MRQKSPKLPEPKNWGDWSVEPFSEYRLRWPAQYDHIPNQVIETWIYRHWREFQAWLPLKPLEWDYHRTELENDEILLIGHVGDWGKTLEYWGNDLLDGAFRKDTWLGANMLQHGTTPVPMIIAKNASYWGHPREAGSPRMCAPFQIVEGHMRLAYLQAMIRRNHHAVKLKHEVFVATLPHNKSLKTDAVNGAA